MEKILLLYLVLNVFNYTKPDRDNVYRELINQDIKHPEIVLKQSILETNCGKAGVGKTRNNLFGFKGKNGYKYYDSWIDSVKDYKKWQDKKYTEHLKNHHKNTKCDYYHFICHTGYVDGKKCSENGIKYVNRLKSIK